MNTRHVQVYDGEWVKMNKRGNRNMCCDCQLVHELNFKIKDGAIYMQAKRLTKPTYDARMRG